ncbi:cation channel sperm-associated auxiliary subunit epsilon-like isoform X2 [Sminthopsis crassicaudata]|uniref:cation channel sperm-associated auxiliary subunit epsilon-like isoform X2 n=2 Tax=Sminthopsis crassicaudata TaxID=9301 RepID=UPI003D69B40A
MSRMKIGIEQILKIMLFSVPEQLLPKTEMLCEVEGVHIIRPKILGKSEEAEKRYLFVDRPTECFLWYYQSSQVTNKSLQNIMMWIYDPENAGPDELYNNASYPSVNSRSITRQFLSMGEDPLVVSGISFEVYYPEVNKREGIWKVQIPHKKRNIFLFIKGNSVAFQDCFIAPCSILMTYMKHNFSENSGDLPITTNTKENILFDWASCFPAAVVTISYWETLYSNDAFNTSQKIRVPPNMLTDEERRNVQDVNLLEEGIVFLTAGSLYLKRNDDFIKLDQRFKIPPNIIGTETRSWCWPDYAPREGLELSEIVLWTETEVLLGYTNLRFFSLIQLEELLDILNFNQDDKNLFSIHLAAYTSHPTGISLMIAHKLKGSQNNVLYLAFYNEDTYKWELQDFLMSFSSNKKLNTQFLYTALPNFVIWDDTTVYYSYQNYSKHGFLRTSVGEENLSDIASGSHIHQVFIDYFGNGVIKMYNNIMLYFKTDVTDVALLHEWVDKMDNTVILINPSGELFLANLNYGRAKLSEYPLLLELYSSTYEEDSHCPYILFQSNVYLSNIHLDKRDELTFWCEVIYPENFGVHSIVETYGPDILKEERFVQYEIALGICTKNLTVTFYQRIDYEAVNNYSKLQDEHTGHVMIQLRPSQFAKTCPLSNQAIHVFVGCYPKRHIVLKGYEENECNNREFDYIIKKQFLRGNPSEHKHVHYNISEYGCPLNIYMFENFHPVLQLYDGNKFIEDIEVNFIIWEIYERIDFSYSLSMHSAGCVNEAQTWKSMIKENKDLPIEKVWGPENYKNCFSFSTGKPGDLSQPYEIINSSNNNKIIWKNRQIGFYVFRAKIIDPNYSFCELTATFAIETFGMLPKTDPILVLLIMLFLILFIFICLLISYFHYLKMFRKFIYEPTLQSKHKYKHSIRQHTL